MKLMTIGETLEWLDERDYILEEANEREIRYFMERHHGNNFVKLFVVRELGDDESYFGFITTHRINNKRMCEYHRD